MQPNEDIMRARTRLIHRLPNGTIDIDYYRNEALMERKRAFSRSIASISGFASVVWPVVASVLIFGVAATVRHVPTVTDAAAYGATITAAF